MGTKEDKLTVKKISIFRHGMPEAHHRYTNSSLLKGSDLVKFINEWNTCALSSDNVVPPEVHSIISAADKCISSSLKRSVESFRLVGIEVFESSSLLDEAGTPHGFGSGITMPFIMWGLLIRIMWFSGYSGNAESYSDFKKRIRKAYDYVNGFTAECDTIAVIGHGFTNMQLRKEMKRNHWKQVEHSGGHDYWSFDRFEKRV